MAAFSGTSGTMYMFLHVFVYVSVFLIPFSYFLEHITQSHSVLVKTITRVFPLLFFICSHNPLIEPFLMRLSDSVFKNCSQQNDAFLKLFHF